VILRGKDYFKTVRDGISFCDFPPVGINSNAEDLRAGSQSCSSFDPPKSEASLVEECAVLNRIERI
jgi:hypothetical protein